MAREAGSTCEYHVFQENGDGAWHLLTTEYPVAAVSKKQAIGQAAGETPSGRFWAVKAENYSPVSAAVKTTTAVTFA